MSNSIALFCPLSIPPETLRCPNGQTVIGVVFCRFSAIIGGRGKRTTEKIIGSLVDVSGHTFDIRYDLFLTTERLIAVIIQHPADNPQFTSAWQSMVLGTLWTSGRGNLKKIRTAQEKRRKLQGMSPAELAESHPRNIAIRFNEIDSAEVRSRFFQHQLRFYLSAPSNTGRMVGFNLSKKQVPEAKRLLKLASLSEDS